MSNRSTTASSSSASTKANRRSAGSSSPTAPRKSRSGARSSLPAHGKSNDDGKRVPLDVKAGDTILFGKYSGQEIKLDGEEYIIMREDEVLGVIDGADAKKKK